jgi:hypothetical protein
MKSEQAVLPNPCLEEEEEQQQQQQQQQFFPWCYSVGRLHG